MLASVLAACGGGDDDAAPTTTEAPATTTTEAPEPTTSSTDAPTTTEGEAPSTTEADPTTGPIMPLTGLPLTDEVLAARPAMVVKIDNHPQARPQFGLNGADIVFEENVENLTRFAAVFQTNAPAKVGPVRSGRTQDVDLLASFDEPLFVWSGGNPSVTRAISSSTLVSLSPTTTQRRVLPRPSWQRGQRAHALRRHDRAVLGVHTDLQSAAVATVRVPRA
ncbi:MAG: DUF3048 domain-containing protein [Ilumatobacteraceae bacterium]